MSQDSGSRTEGESGVSAEAEARFRRKLAEDGALLSYPHAWPRAPRAGAAGRGRHLCIFCGGQFRRRGDSPPHFCGRPCSLAASRVRKEYREGIIRDLFPGGASDSLIGGATGLSASSVGQKRAEMGLLRPSPAEREDADEGKKSVAAEMEVCADLLREGYEVFRAVGAKRSCDLVVLRRDRRDMYAARPRRVEVREVGLRADGSPRVPPESRRHEYDTLALALPDGSLFYLHASEAYFQRLPRPKRPKFPANSELP